MRYSTYNAIPQYPKSKKHPYENLANLVYLGLGACALCFVTWNFAVGKLGAVKTSTYIYLVPVVTLATSALVLGEPVTPLSAVGAALTVAGLALSEHKKGTAS